MPQLKLQVNNRHIKYAVGKLLCDRAQRKTAIAKSTKRKRKRKKTQRKREKPGSMHETFPWGGWEGLVGDDDAVIQFGFKIANSVSQHVKASRCLHRGSTASRYLHEYMYNTWVGRLKSNWASACKQSLRGLLLRDASFSLMCRDARCLSRPF